MNTTATAATIKHLLSDLLEDLRRRRLLSVVALMLVALVALPIVLSRGSSPASAGTAAATSGSAQGQGGAPLAATGVDAGAARPSTAHAPRIAAHARDPFAPSSTHVSLPTLPPTTAAPAATPAAAIATRTKVSAPSGSTPTAVRTGGGTATRSVTPTVTRTVTATTPAVSPAPVFTRYGAVLRFGQTGEAPRQLSDASRFTVLPSPDRVAALFLGILGDGRSAEFLVSNRATVTGDGSCHPSTVNCVYLTLKPRQEELFLLSVPGAGTFEYALRYAAVHRSHTATAPEPSVSKLGRRLVVAVAKLLPSLRTLRYSSRTGLMSLSLRHLR